VIEYSVGLITSGASSSIARAKNALTSRCATTFVHAVRSARGDATVRALLITGTGDRLRRHGPHGIDGGPRRWPDSRRAATAEALRIVRAGVIRELWELANRPLLP